jgi:aldehyde:ferredoxin oxidoreductase
MDTTAKTIEEKKGVLRKYRIAEYEKLKDEVYPRRAWNKNGVRTLEKVKPSA